MNKRDTKWSESIAVGDKDFVLETKNKLGAKAIGRKAIENDDGYVLKEPGKPYNNVLATEKHALRLENARLWDIYYNNTGRWFGPNKNN